MKWQEMSELRRDWLSDDKKNRSSRRPAFRYGRAGGARKVMRWPEVSPSKAAKFREHMTIASVVMLASTVGRDGGRVYARRCRPAECVIKRDGIPRIFPYLTVSAASVTLGIAGVMLSRSGCHKRRTAAFAALLSSHEID
ncbi:hypothetical protein ETD86_35965 [Nonomuraea turkmeniaca]|uniref:Uncharacterized protein n=1 Tax=Nonomuraea turkmeniaca TaxID=103838 RepID=A0A5S4F5P0_9ACTN|nr:hypothetical protein [Nonomuraea turkmeniaca]TMR11381.1 hypothetical protein ETD86_35965 [Nonomuraea turkmeniaca]